MNIQKLLKLNTKIDKLTDGTYEYTTLKPIQFKDGFQATFQTLADNYNANEFWNLVTWYEKITDGTFYIGKYDGNIEISFHFDFENDAKEICKEYNQYSYWDWANNTEIKNKYYKLGLGNDYI